MAIRQLKPYLKNIADAIREKTTDAVNLLDFKTARNRDGYTGGVFEFTDTGFTYTGTYYFVFDISLEANKTYILSCDFDTGSSYTPTWCTIYADGTRTSGYVNASLTPTSDVVAIWIYPKPGETSTRTSTFNNLMLEEGEIAHEYVPYGYKEPINAQDFPSKITDVYDKGKQAEYDRFWDSYQNYGKSTSYINSFAGTNWNDEIFNPKYPIITSAAPNRSNSMFYYTSITKIMIPIYFYDTTTNSLCYGAKIKVFGDDTGGGLWVTRDKLFTSAFVACTNLTEIRFLDYNEKGEYVPSEIGNSINFSACPLSVASMKNIIAHLVNYSGTSSSGANTLTFSADCWTRLETDSSAPDGGLWSEYVQSLGWNI